LERQRLEVVAREGVDAGYAANRADGGNELDDRIRRIVSEMKMAEEAILWRRKEQQEQRIRTSRSVIGASVLLGVVILLAVYYHLERETGRRRRSEFRLVHLQAIVRARTSDELFSEVCRVALEHGRFRIAGIALSDPESGRIQPVAWWARKDAHSLRNSLADEANATDPWRSAIRAGTRFVCNDIAGDPRMLPWREEALALGCLSAAGLPIKVNAKLFGFLIVFAARGDFFDDETLRLLDEVTSDIAFALHNLDLHDLELTRMVRLSHEFRTSLNCIIGFTDLLIEQGEGPLGDAYADYVHHVNEEAHRLLTLINDILNSPQAQSL